MTQNALLDESQSPHTLLDMLVIHTYSIALLHAPHSL